MMVSFCAVLFPRDVLDEILNLIDSVSEVFLRTLSNAVFNIFMSAVSKSLQSRKTQFKRRRFDKPWFGPACELARKQYHRAIKIKKIINPLTRKKIALFHIVCAHACIAHVTR